MKKECRNCAVCRQATSKKGICRVQEGEAVKAKRSKQWVKKIARVRLCDAGCSRWFRVM
jgi:ribosomal protein S12